MNTSDRYNANFYEPLGITSHQVHISESVIYKINTCFIFHFCSYEVGNFIGQHEGWNTFKNLSLIPTHLRQHGLFAPNISPSGSFIYADSHHGYMQFNNGNNQVTNLLTLQRLLSRNGINSDGQRHYQYVLPPVYHTCKDLLVMSFHRMKFHNYEVDRAGLHSCILLFNTTSHEIQRRISCSSEHFENEYIEDLALDEENQRYLYIHTTSKLLVIDTQTGEGSFDSAIWSASDLYAISENTIVLTDEQHLRLWVAEINKQRIRSMCNGDPDDIEG